MLSIQSDKLIVSGDKVFFTLQGEGRTVGYPVVFLRLKFCNLRCVWCDTPYAVFPDREDFKAEGESWTLKETVRQINKAWGVKNNKIQKRLVITGGEPMLQFRAIDNFIDLIPDWKVEIETNGTILPTDKMVQKVQFNCSPKLTNSGNKDTLRYKPEVIKALNSIPSTRFKFVVAQDEDLDEIEKDFINKGLIDVSKVILMPLGVDNDTLNKHLRNVAEKAKEKGYRLISRLQIQIWGAKRRT